MHIYLFIFLGIPSYAATDSRAPKASTPNAAEVARHMTSPNTRTKAQDKPQTATSTGPKRFSAMLLRKLRALDAIERDTSLLESDRKAALERTSRDFLNEEIALRKQDLDERYLEERAANVSVHQGTHDEIPAH